MKTYTCALTAMFTWLCTLALTPFHALAAPTLRVRAQVSVELHVVHTDAALRVEGVLQDDVEARLANRQLSVTFHNLSGTQHGRSRNLKTDSRGHFSFEAPCTACTVTVEFAGNAYYEHASATQLVAAGRPTLTLEMVEPSELAVSLDKPSVSIVVRASGPAPVNDIPVTLENELARTLATGTTAPDGVLRVAVDTRALGPYGLGELIARAPGNSEHTAARTSKAILRTLATKTDLQVGFDAKLRQLSVSVGLQALSGPIAQRAIGVFVDGKHICTLITDEKGHASSTVTLKDSKLAVGTHRLVARFQSDIPGLLSSESPTVAAEIAAPQRPSILWLLLPVIASVAFVLWSARRRPAHAKRTETSQLAGPEVRMGKEGRGRTAPLFTLSGHVEDVDSGQPVDAAIEITAKHRPLTVLRTALDGGFESEPLLAGQYQVRVVAPGYVALTFALELPHHGAGNAMRVAVRSLRVLALETYGSFAAHVLSESRTRGKTIREIVSAADGCGKATPNVTTLADATEHLAYARPIPFESDLLDLQQAAANALREVDDPDKDPQTLT